MFQRIKQQASFKKPKHPLDMPFMPHASTELRARVARGEPVQHWVGEGVSRYIAQHHLYQAA